MTFSRLVSKKVQPGWHISWIAVLDGLDYLSAAAPSHRPFQTHNKYPFYIITEI
jgi:hypothetical protein